MNSIILAQLQSYLAGRISLREFQELLIDVISESEASRKAPGLAYELELRIAEFTGGHISEDELKHALLNDARETSFLTVSFISEEERRHQPVWGFGTAPAETRTVEFA